MKMSMRTKVLSGVNRYYGLFDNRAYFSPDRIVPLHIQGDKGWRASIAG